MPQVNTLESLCVVHMDFDIWSGKARLTASDLKLGDGGEIPPETLAQLGNKKVCDPTKLKGFARLKSQARRTLDRVGMPFMNGFAIPVTKVDEICEKLDDIGIQFNQLKHQFISHYDSAIDEWIAENPDYESTIRTGVLPKETVEERIGFEYQIFMVQPANDAEGASSKRLSRKVDGLGDDLISEIVREANKFYAEKLAGRNQCGSGAKLTFRNIRDKVDGLSFLNSSFDPLVHLLNQTLHGFDQVKGKFISGQFFYQVMATVLIMSDRNKIEQYADGSITLDSMAASLSPEESSWSGMIETPPLDIEPEEPVVTTPEPAIAEVQKEETPVQSHIVPDGHRYPNPWGDAFGFIPLGQLGLYDLYALVQASGLVSLGARFGLDGDYLSGGLDQEYEEDYPLHAAKERYLASRQPESLLEDDFVLEDIDQFFNEFSSEPCVEEEDIDQTPAEVPMAAQPVEAPVFDDADQDCFF